MQAHNMTAAALHTRIPTKPTGCTSPQNMSGRGRIDVPVIIWNAAPGRGRMKPHTDFT